MRVLVAVPVVSVVVIAAAYVAIIVNQPSHPDVFVVPFVAGYMVATAVLLAVSLLESPRVVSLRPALRGAAAGGLLVMGVLALFSIGLPLMFAGALATAATVGTVRRHPSRTAIGSAAAGAAVAFVVLVVGFDVAWRIIVCPPSGEMGGTQPGLFVSGIAYDCSNGRLTIASP